jgi:hypothetical protein
VREPFVEEVTGEGRAHLIGRHVVGELGDLGRRERHSREL